jgi:hypothetical protein
MTRAGSRVWAALCAAAVLAGGCRHAPKDGQNHGAVQRGKAPTYAEVAAAYNQRVAPLDRLWARTTLRARYPNEKGEIEQIQFEGYLNYMRPWKLLMTLQKLGEEYAILGSNDTTYWWMEKSDKPVAYVGEHAKATPERIAKLGLPVHPLDLLEVLGITALPESMPGVGTGEGGEVQWSDDGQWLVVTASVGSTRRRLYVDPKTYEPGQIELIGGDGRAVLRSTLKKYDRVQMVGVKSPPRIANEVTAEAEERKLNVRLTINDPEVSASRPKAAAFDMQRWIKSFKVQQVFSLDAPAAPGAGG